MYVRLKRKNQTIFLHIDPADNFFNIKQRVGELYALDPANIQLLGSDKVSSSELYVYFYTNIYKQKRELLDMATVSDQEVKNDDILYFLFTKDSGGGWEEIQVEAFSTFPEESAELRN
jgi:hypothetical protein